MELLKLLNTSEIIAQVISFLLLVFLLRIFAWRRILRFLDERREKIAAEFKKIEETQAVVARMKAEYDEKIAGVEDLARKRIVEAVAEGRKITDAMRKKAHEEAQDILETARQNIGHELAKAKEDLKEKIIDLTIKSTEQLLEEKRTEDDDRRFVKEFLESMQDYDQR